MARRRGPELWITRPHMASYMFSRQSPIANPPAITSPATLTHIGISVSGVPSEQQAQHVHEGYNRKDNNCRYCKWLVHLDPDLVIVAQAAIAIEAERRGLFRTDSRAATNCKFCASLTSRCHVLCFAESQELIWIEDHRSNGEAVSLGLFHLALGSRLPGIEFRWKLVTVIHDLPDALVVFASKPSCEVWHVNVPRK